MKRFISFSGGVESSTMCLLYADKADAIFADAGWEHKPVEQQIQKVEKYVRENIRDDFKIIRVKNPKWTLPEYIRYAKYYPSFKSRFCTRIFKIEPIDDFLSKFDEVEIMIGLNVDEAEMRTGNHGLLDTVKYSYPLVDDKINRDMCEDILRSAGLHPSFPVYMSRGGCVGCYYKSKNEFRAMVFQSPEEFDEVMELEEEIQDKRDKFFHVKINIPQGMRKFKQETNSELLPFSAEEMYAETEKRKPCGVFCNR